MHTQKSVRRPKRCDLKLLVTSFVVHLNQIGERLENIKRQLNDISSLKVHAISIVRLQSEIDRAKDEINDLEISLSSSGSTKTADDVQNELSELSGEM